MGASTSFSVDERYTQCRSVMHDVKSRQSIFLISHQDVTNDIQPTALSNVGRL